MKDRPSSFSEKVLVKLFERCKFAGMTPEQQHLYIRTIMAEGKAAVARSLREKGISISTIAEACDLTEEQVLAL